MQRRQFLKCIAGGSAAIVVLPSIFSAGTKGETREERLFPLYSEIDKRFYLASEENALIVDGEDQKMYLVDGHNGFRINNAYDVSTGKAGFGYESGSGKTPTGIHRIKEKYGDDAQIGTIFKGRQNTGRIAKIYESEYDSPADFLTSRIMWLDGCDEQNSNTHSRLIYIHGTSEEGLIGTPASHGCIRMKNRDVIELYDLVDIGTYVNIAGKI